MRPKACTRCRQWKVGCDADVAGPAGCTKCQEQGLSCFFDRSFRRETRRRKVAEMQAELDQLRKQATQAADEHSSNGLVDSVVVAPAPRDPGPSPGSTAEPVGIIQNGDAGAPEMAWETWCVTDKHIDSLHLAAAHVNELFRIYLIRCHPYLPFSMCKSVKTIHEKCPLLLWAICAVASGDPLRTQLEPSIRVLVADALEPQKSSTVEMVQALLILCMWPYLADQRTDPSFIYSGIATQICLTMGLHRPNARSPFDGSVTFSSDVENARKTTWLACFAVASIQASRRGVPAIVQPDQSLISLLNSPGVAPDLSHLCRISQLTIDATQALGARGPSTAGLADPAVRNSLINVFGGQFDELKRRHFPKPSDIVEIFYLGSRLQLWSFALHNDAPFAASILQTIAQAREDAVRLIQIACEKNLSLVPFYTRRSVCYAALLLYRIKLGPYGWQDDMIEHHVGRAQEALSVSEPRMGYFLATVMAPVNRDAFARASGDPESPHRSRMAAFLVFDFRQVYIELQKADMVLSNEFLDLENLPWTE